MQLLLALPSAAAELTAYFPTKQGLSWRYQVTKRSVMSAAGDSRSSEKPGTVHEEVVGSAGPSTAVIQRTVNETNATMGKVTVRSVLHVRTEPNSVSIVATGPADAAPKELPVPSPLLSTELPGPVIQGNAGTMILDAQLVSQAPSSTDVPAGSFADCLLTETKSTVSGSLNGVPIGKGSVVVESWYARGVGLVREERTLALSLSPTPGGPLMTVEEVSSKVLEAHAAGP